MKRKLFIELTETYLGELTRFALRLTKDRYEAEDLVQATLERAFDARKSVRKKSAFRAWLFRIARNLHIDRQRARASRPPLELVETLEDMSTDAFVGAQDIERCTARSLEQALSKLPEMQREVIVLADVWEFTYDEIATILDCPKGTIRSRLSRARDGMRQHLARLGITSTRSTNGGGRS